MLFYLEASGLSTDLEGSELLLPEIDDYPTPATDAILHALGDDGGYWGTPRKFMRQFSRRTGIDTRLLDGAIGRLHKAGKIAKYYGGNTGFYVVGISLPDRTYKETDIRGLGEVYRDPARITAGV